MALEDYHAGGKMTGVTLNTTEQMIAIEVAKKRAADNLKKGNVNRKAGPQSNEFTELEGVAGEIAVAKHFNVYPDFGDKPGIHDLIICGWKVDVKTTKYPKGRLEAAEDKRDADVDVYLLVTGLFPVYTLRGWQWEDNLFLRKNRLTYEKNNSTVYQVAQSTLYPLERLK